MARKAAIIGRRLQPCAYRAAFAAGLTHRGWAVESVEVGAVMPTCDLVVGWGLRSGGPYYRAQRERGGRVVVLERGYVGDRMIWTSVSQGGGLNGYGNFVTPDDGGERWDRHHAGVMQPWQNRADGYVLIMGQVPGDMSLRHAGDINARYHDMRRGFEARGLKTKFRAHPGSAGLTHNPVPLATDLAGAKFTCCYNSNSGVDSVLAGIPCVTLDRGAMAYGVTGHTWDDPPTPDRSKWAHKLAWAQYLSEEMRSGFCQETLGL